MNNYIRLFSHDPAKTKYFSYILDEISRFKTDYIREYNLSNLLSDEILLIEKELNEKFESILSKDEFYEEDLNDFAVKLNEIRDRLYFKPFKDLEESDKDIVRSVFRKI